MKVLVTGATGFVGSHLCAYLQTHGIAQRKVVRSDIENNQDNIVVGNINGTTDWSQALNGADVIVHLAARVHVMRDCVDDPLSEFRKVNTEGTLNLARQAVSKGIKRFVFVSTVKVNGEKTVENPFNADDLPAPSDPYSVSKAEAEKGLLQIAHGTEMEAVILRPPLVYGKGVGGNFERLLNIVKKGWYLPFGSITNRRSLIGIENLCSVIQVCLRHPAAANKVLLVSDGEDISTPELIKLIAQSQGLPAKVFPFPVRLLCFGAKVCGKEAELGRLTDSLQIDSSSTRSMLNWQPPLTLKQGLDASI